jgi:hypothetical protein
MAGSVADPTGFETGIERLRKRGLVDARDPPSGFQSHPGIERLRKRGLVDAAITMRYTRRESILDCPHRQKRRSSAIDFKS